MENIYNWKFNSSTLQCPACDQTFFTLSTMKRHSNKCKPSGIASVTITAGEDVGQPETRTQAEVGTQAEVSTQAEVRTLARTQVENMEPVLKKMKMEIAEPELKRQPQIPDIPEETPPQEVMMMTKNEPNVPVYRPKKSKCQRKSSEKMYKCQHCTYETQLRHNFERHFRGHEKEKAFKCPYCSFSSDGRNTIKAHLNSYHRLQEAIEPLKGTSQSDKETPSYPSDDSECLVEEIEGACAEDSQETGASKTKETKVDDSEDEKENDCLFDQQQVRTDSPPIAKFKEMLSTIEAFRAEYRLPKYICPDCPFKTNSENGFRFHLKNHRAFPAGGGKMYSCPHCTFSSVKVSVRDSHVRLHKEVDVYVPDEEAGTAASNRCRCDLAAECECPELACRRQLLCPCCSVRSASVDFLRNHVLDHVSLTVASRFRIFDSKLDSADELLAFACTRKT